MDVNLRLPIVFNTEETLIKTSLEIDVELVDCIIKDMVFYSINAISVYSENGVIYTTIHSNGDDFICSLPMVQVESLIADSLLTNKF